MRAPPTLLLFCCVALPQVGLAQQCPDGTPPPCAAARRPAPRRAAPPPAVRARSFLLLPFRNVTRVEAQEWLVSGAPLMLATALGQFRDLTVVPDERLLAARRRLGLAPEAALDAAQLRRLAQETDGWTVVSGTVIASGGRLRIGAQALDALTGNVLVRAEVEAAADADAREAFDQLAVRLLEVAGLPPASSNLAALTTSSLDAYRADVRGITLLHQGAFVRARDAFREAVRLDSSFALAWAHLALAGAAWNLGELINPFGATYAAAERAAALSARLPPRLAAKLRLQASFFRGRLSAARLLADSLVRTDPDDVDTRLFLTLFEAMDPTLDTTVAPPRMRASLNRAVAYAREVLERDPGRRYVYSVLGLAYGLAGGLWWGAVQGVRREANAFAALLTGNTDAWFVPVLRDSFELMTPEAFEAVPEAERARLRRRAADAGMQWIERWLAAGPNDADAHLWASRLAELQGDLPRALRELERADSLGVEAQMENVKGRRVTLLMRLGRVGEAAGLTDSLVAAGALRYPLIRVMDRGWSYGSAALFLTRRFARAAALAATASPPAPGVPACQRLLVDLEEGVTTSLPDDIAFAVRDTVTAHAGAFAAQLGLRPCLPSVVGLRQRRDAPPRPAAGARLLAVGDSLAAANEGPAAYYAGVAAWTADRGTAARLAERLWFAETERTLVIGRRFRPGEVRVEGDSVTVTWELAEPGPFRWDVPGLPITWSFQALFDGEGDQRYFVTVRHPWRERPTAAQGGLAELVASIEDRSVSAGRATAALRQVSVAIAATEAGFRVVVRGDLAGELRRLRPRVAILTAIPCLRAEVSSQGSCPETPVPITFR